MRPCQRSDDGLSFFREVEKNGVLEGRGGQADPGFTLLPSRQTVEALTGIDEVEAFDEQVLLLQPPEGIPHGP